ncbi:hypothetical protein [Novosphingobium sp. EMRT-2]|uniref:hypothetical protein n=1 Tax=Novosphingobium sp. EMRT-2 TaxID=2571749 RepID=UPI0010BD43CB|nr:hypothetical protein [Novosphingobium sp. EMRT-2]QCI93883.1 hypothetical protein FA702_10180 [Novosphingobium sp. EMRT-2]
MSEALAPAPKRSARRTWTLLLGVLAVLLVFAATYGRHRQEVEIRNVLFANSARAAAQLEGCMMQRVPLAGGWTEVPETKGHRRAWNAARTLRVDVIDQGARRRLEIAAQGGRALEGGEAAALKACLGGER